MATSFISEHTAEYVLVPNIVSILARRFVKVIPFYFLSTREGGHMSGACDPYDQIRVVNVFARRPKVDIPGQPTIEVKFNSTLFDVAHNSLNAGIPVFAGVPLVSSIMELSLAAHCAWFSLLGSYDSDVYYHLSLDGKVSHRSPQASPVKGPLDDNEIIDLTLEGSREMFWSEAIENLRLIRRGARQYHRYWFMFGGRYYPFSLLLFDRDSNQRDIDIQ